MPYADPTSRRAREAARASKRRYRERKKVEKYGSAAAGRDMRGRHGKHVTGTAHPRWNGKRLITGHGYVLVRVAPDHPRAFGPPRLRRFKYAYEHDIVMEQIIGRSLRRGEVVHHLNGRRDDNRPLNLVVEMKRNHSRRHAQAPGARDRLGRFAPGRRQA